MDVLDLLKDKKKVLKFLLETIDKSDKMATGLRKMASASNISADFKIEKLCETMANQSIQIKHLSIIALVYAQSSSFDGDIAQVMNKMGRGEEALQQMFKNKLNGK